MRLTRVLLLGTAMTASAATGFLAVSFKKNNTEHLDVAKLITRPILVASKNVAAGESLNGAVKWAEWPASGIQPSYVEKTTNPDALETFQTRQVRTRLYAGDPIRSEHFRRDSLSPMAGMLPTGKRAVAVKIAADTSAGGFILPNDFADVIMSRRRDGSKGARRELNSSPTEPSYITETILQNVRVLAIDQTMQEDDHGRKVMVGQTATLELTPLQAEVVTAAQQMAERLTLSLRSSEDSNAQANDGADHLVFSPTRDNTVRIVSGGTITEYGVTNQ